MDRDFWDRVIAIIDEYSDDKANIPEEDVKVLDEAIDLIIPEED